jgi:hypothetical protein
MSKPVAEPHRPAEVLTRLGDFYRQLGQSLLPQLSRIYHSQVVFIDPVSQYDGVEALECYFSQLLKKVKYCHFDVQPALVQGDDASLFWRMEYAHPALNKGQGISMNGASHLRLAENRVIYQRDYYDLGAMLYEHVPVLGGAIRALKARLN